MKIVRNTTATPVTILDVGVTIGALSSYTIQPTDYLLWGASSNAVTRIGDGTIVVNDGSKDLSISDGVDLIKGAFPKTISGASTGVGIGNIGDRLKVDAQVTTSLLNTLSTKLRLFLSVADTTVTSAAWVTLYDLPAGNGQFLGCQWVNDNAAAIVRLTIDGEVIFEVAATALNAFTYFTGGGTQNGSMFDLSSDSKVIDFSPRAPIKYNTSVKIEVRSSGGSLKNKAWFAWLTREG